MGHDVATDASNDARNKAQRWYEYNVGKTHLKSMPDIFSIESTNFCNIRCVMCPRGEPDIMSRELGHMKTDLLESMLDGWEFFTEPVWLHLFGEPLMNPQIFNQIAIAKRAGVTNVGISTNATLLTPDKTNALIDSGLDSIMLCIDGNSKATYESIRKSSVFTYEEVCENVSQFLDELRRRNLSKPHAMVSIIVMDETKAQLADFETRWMAAGAHQVLFKPYTTWGGQTEHRFSALAPFEQRLALESPEPAYRANPCWHMWSSVVVTWDGRIVPCCFDFDATVSMGDLNHERLTDIWNGPKYVALRSAELEHRNEHALCRNCREAPQFARDPAVPAPDYEPTQI